MTSIEHGQLAKRFISVSKYCSLSVMGIGIFVLAGWAFDISAFKTVLPGLQTMKANTAFAFFVAGMGLWFSTRENPKPVTLRIVQICNGVALLIGSLTLAEYVFRLDLGIDQLLFRDLQTSPSSFPGRMAFASALCLSLIGIASILIHAGRGKNIDLIQYLAVMVLAISLLALVGYIYGVQALYELDQFSSMALHTAVGFALLAIGALSVRPDQGWMKTLSTEAAGGVLLRGLLPVLFGIPVFLGWLIVLGHRAGLYETRFGLAMLALLTVGFLIIILWLNSRQLNRVDENRKQAEEQLRTLNAELEMRVAARTAELRVSEARFYSLFEHAPVSIWEEDFSAVRQYIDDLRRAGVTDFSAFFDAHPEVVAKCATLVKIVDVNRATLEMYRAESKEQLLADLSKVLGTESMSALKEELIALTRGNMTFENETINYTLRGESRVIFLRLTIAPGYEQTWSKVFVGISDITERRQVEAKLQQSEVLFRALFDLSPDAILVIDPHDSNVSWPIIDCNVVACIMNGYRRDELIGHSIDILNITPGTEAERIAYLKQLREVGHPKLETYHRRKNGVVFPVEVSTTLITVGERELVIGIDRDITERRQIEDALREAEIKYRTLVEHLPAIVYLDQYDPTVPAGYRPIYMSPQVETILGYRPDEFIEDPNLWPSLLHPDDRQEMLDAEGWHYKQGEPFHHEYRVIGRAGRVVWLRDEAIMIKEEASERVYSQGVLLDITARKMAEEALRQNEERFRLMSWATKDALWDWDLRTNQIWWGEGLQKMFHYPSDAQQADIEWQRDHIHPQDRDKVDRSKHQALQGGMEFWSKEYRFQRFDGTYADVMDRGYILRDGQGNPNRMIGAMMDITERKQAEATILQQNTMLSSLHQITLDLLSYREITPLLDALVELAAKFMDASYAEIMIVDAEMLKVRAATQSQHHLVGQCVGREEALLSWKAVDTREPAVLSDYQQWPHRRAVYDTFQLHAVADFPILNDEECLGVLALGRETADYEFNLDQIQYGRLFANLTALVLNNAQLREALREQSIRDELTGLYNRRYMEEALKQQLSRAARQLRPLGIIMLDIDHFKSINDTYGHSMGDALLRELGQLLKSHVRIEDIACRYGGEEFLLIMPDASLETTHQRAELLRQSAKALRVEEDIAKLLDGITLSLGVAIYPQHGQTTESLLNAADAALYRAKQEGRDRVVMAGTA